MKRICKYCGQEYEGDPGGSCCPNCAKKQRETSVRERTCQVCGKSFPGGPAAKYCPECRIERRREADRRHKARARNGQVRKLGSTDYCIVCGKPYTVEGGLQHYCKACAPDAYRELDRLKSLEWNRANMTPEGRRAERQAATAPLICVVCGKPFYPSDASITCSKECSRAHEKERRKNWEKENREARNAYHREKRKEKKTAPKN